jgi:tetrahydromethanopterin S-methyltransferase subunit G
MSIVDDTRKVLQDFIAPELREIQARLDALEKRMDARFDQSEKIAAARHEAITSALISLQNYNEVRERLARLESRESVHQ